MATYVLDGKTARIFAEVQSAPVSGQTKTLEREGENGVRVGLRACEARALFAKISLRPFASLQNRL